MPHFGALAARIIYAKISPKEAGKTAPQRGMHTPYGLQQLIQGHVVPTTLSTTGTGTATKLANRMANTAMKSVKVASTSRGGQCEQPSWCSVRVDEGQKKKWWEKACNAVFLIT